MEYVTGIIGLFFGFLAGLVVSCCAVLASSGRKQEQQILELLQEKEKHEKQEGETIE